MAPTETLDRVQETSAPETATRLEVTVERDVLLRELTAVRGAVETKTTIPILANVLLEAGGDRLSITATCLDRTIEAGCTADVSSFGRICVPARKLLDYVKLLPSGTVKITEKENGWVHLRCGRSNTKMVGVTAKNFPLIAEFSGEAIPLPSDTLLGMLNRVAFSVSEEESRYTLKGAKLILSGQQIILVATDGHRLAEVKAISASSSFPDISLLIPGDAIDLLRSLLTHYDGPWVPMGEDSSSLYFFVGDKKLISRKMAQQSFPNYEAAIPATVDVPVMLDVDTTLGALRRAMALSDAQTSAVAMKVTANELVFESRSENIGETEESVEILGGTDLRIGFNGNYVRQLLEIADQPVELHLHDEESAALFRIRYDDGMEYRYVVMPLRLR